MNRGAYFKEFHRTGGLTRKKLREYIPTMIITNLSVLLLHSVDGLVVGNFDGMDGLSSIAIFYPLELFIGSVCCLTGVGISISLSTAMGRNDTDRLDRVKGMSVRIMIIMAAFLAVAQIPVVWLMIRSYGLDDEMYALTWQYATGMMISMPISMISTVGTYQLQIAGRMKVLMRLSVIEGISNLIFDLLFVGALHMGVAGAGFGTAVANLIRCGTTVFYLARYTDMYKSSSRRCSLKDMLEVLSFGAPDAAFQLVCAFQNYFMIKILLNAFGEDGGTIKGVCAFTLCVINVLINGIMGGMRPLTGLLTGADDRKGLRTLMKQGMRLSLIGTGLATALIIAFPGFFFTLHGVDNIPYGGLLSVRLNALYFVFLGFDNLYRMYLGNRKDSRFATILTLVGNATLPVFAFIISRIAEAPYIFLSYLITETIVFIASAARYRWWVAKDKEELKSTDEIVLYMTVRPDQAVEASRKIRAYAEENGVDKRVAYRAALCMEEMVAYAKNANEADARRKLADDNGSDNKAVELLQTDAGNSALPPSEDVNIEIMVRFKGKQEAVFLCLDDGECISLNADKDQQKLVTDNYGLLKKLATSVEYQYLLNMNYSRFVFTAKA